MRGRPRNCAARSCPILFRRNFKATLVLGSRRNLTLRSIKTLSARSYKGGENIIRTLVEYYQSSLGFTLNSASPQSSNKARSSTGPVSQAYSFFDCLTSLNLYQYARKRTWLKGSHQSEIRQVIDPKVLGLSAEIDRRRVE